MATVQEISEGLTKPETNKLLRNFALSLTRDKANADDLVQETALRAITGAHLFQAGTNLDAWLVTIMRNNFYNLKKRAKNSPIICENVDCAVDQDPGSSMLLEQVAEVLEGLSKDVAGMLLAKVVDGRKEKDIARDFGIPVGTVKSRISRARETLREKLT